MPIDILECGVVRRKIVVVKVVNVVVVSVVDWW
jgi:hypothetical protein